MKFIVLALLPFLVFYSRAGPCGDCPENECCVKNTYPDDDVRYECQKYPNETYRICQPEDSMTEDGYYENDCPCEGEQLVCKEIEDFENIYYCQEE